MLPSPWRLLSAYYAHQEPNELRALVIRNAQRQRHLNLLIGSHGLHISTYCRDKIPWSTPAQTGLLRGLVDLMVLIRSQVKCG